jgi:hypothetical protein
MSEGKFQGVVSGTWSTTHSVPVRPVAAVLVGFALVSYLATILWILAVLAFLFIVAAVPTVIWMRRWTRREYGRHLDRVAALPEEQHPAVTAPQPPVIQNFYGGSHLHVTPGAANAGHPLVLPLRDAVIKEN